MVTLTFLPDRPLTRRFLPSDEPMWVKWRENQAALDMACCCWDESPHSACQVSVRHECLKILDEAKQCLERKPRWSTRYSLWFWRMMHRLDENLILIMPEARLAAEALYIKELFQRNIADPITKDTWWQQLSHVVEELNPRPTWGENKPPKTGENTLTRPAFPAGPAPSTSKRTPADVDAMRQVLRGALHVINEKTDRGFRDFAMNGSLQLLSTAALALIAFGIWRTAYDVFAYPASNLPTSTALLLGAAGAIISHMISESSFLVPTGQTVTSFLYYLVVIPAVGAVSAVFTLAVERTEILFAILSRPAMERAHAAAVIAPAYAVIAPAPAGSAPLLSASPPTSGSGAPVEIILPTDDAAAVALVVVAIVAGFFGHRVLRSTMGKLREKLFGNAEKAATPEDVTSVARTLRSTTWS